MRPCTKCKRTYKDGFSFCPYCGTPVAAIPTSGSQVPEPPSPGGGTLDNHQEQARPSSRKPIEVHYSALSVALGVGALVIIVALTLERSDNGGTQPKNSPASTSKQTVTSQPQPSAIHTESNQENKTASERKFEGRLTVSPEVLSRIGANVPGTGFFAKPARLCAALGQEGITSKGWQSTNLELATRASPEQHQRYEARFGATSDWRDCGPTDPLALDSGSRPNELNYVAEGYRERAKRVSLQLDIYDEMHKATAKHRYKSVLSTLFANLGVALPTGLLAAVDAERNFQSTEHWGHVSLSVWRNDKPRDPARDDTAYRGSFEVELRDSAAEAAARAGYQDIFAACRSQVLAHYAAPIQDVGGDGVPTFFRGSVLFDVDWRNRTLPGQGTKLYASPILCTVYPNGKYELAPSVVFKPMDGPPSASEPPQSPAVPERSKPPQDSASSDVIARQETNRLKSTPSASPSSAQSPRAASGGTVYIGDNAHLVCSDPGSTVLALGVTDKDFDALVSAQIAHDKYGIAQLVSSRKVFTVPCGTRILLLYNGFTMDQVRVLEGKQTGAAGWTYRESVRH